MRNRKAPNFTALLVVAASFGASADGAITLYTNRIAFMSAISSSVSAILDYEDAAVGANGLLPSLSYSEEGITISNLSNIISPAFSGGLYDTGSGSNANGALGGTSTVSFTSNFYSAGFDLFTIQPSGDHGGTTVTISISTGESFVVDTNGLANGSDMFVGFVSDVELSSFSIRPTGPTGGFGADRRWANTDNIVISTVAVPEPSGSLLAILGFTTFLVRRRRWGSGSMGSW